MSLVAALLLSTSLSLSSPSRLSAHEYFLREIALCAPPDGLDALGNVLLGRGETLREPQPVALSLHPLLVPLSEGEDGELTGLLRWPGGGGKLPVVRTCSQSRQLTWLAESAEKYVAREKELAEAEAEIAAGGAGTPSSKGGVEGRVLMRVGPFMGEYEKLATGHLEKGSEQSALITCERNQRCFEAWGRPFAFHARLLHRLGRDEEARDVARHALSLPLWTLGDEVDEICGFAQTTQGQLLDDLRVRAAGGLTREQLQRENGMDTRTPSEKALQRASCLLDLATLGEQTFEAIRPELAERYREAGMGAFATFISPDETIN